MTNFYYFNLKNSCTQMIQSRHRTTHLAFGHNNFRVMIPGLWELTETGVTKRNFRKKQTKKQPVVVSLFSLCVL